MKYKIIIRPEAENDLVDVFAWYEDRRKGLGYDFLLQVYAGIRFIEHNPEIHPVEYKGTRKHLTKKFPYKIVCHVDGEKIIVLAVIHGKRSRVIIKKRINNI